MLPPSPSPSALRWLLAGAWALLGLALAHVFFRASEGALGTYGFFNSDSLYLPALYRDLFEDGGRWRGWHLTPAPYFFPDMALYFLLDALTGPFQHAVIAYAAAQLVLLALATQSLVRTVAPREEAVVAQVAAVAVVAALLLLYAEGHFWMMYLSVLSAIHFSVVPLSLVGLALWLRAFRDGSKGALGLLALLSVLATASDGLFIITFTVPLTVSAAVLAWRWRPHAWKRLGAQVLLLALATGAGLRLAKKLAGRRASAEYTRLNLELIQEALRQLQAMAAEQLRGIPGVVLLWSVAVLAALAVVVARRKEWTAPDSPRWGLYAACLFTLLSLGSTTGAVVLTGTFVDASAVRYLVVPLMLPLLGLALVAGLARWRRRAAVAALVLVAGAWGTAVLRRPWRTEGPLLSGFYPDLVRCLDENQARYGLGWGVSSYWHAKYVSMFSRTGLRVNQLHPDGLPYDWINSRDWYLDPRGQYTFVITDELDMAAFHTRFGEPRERFRCDWLEVHVYGPALDAPLRAEMDARFHPRKPAPPAQAGTRASE